ncbi:hypothetical protein O181_103665 [Austropuccinia psidii MF-1]|uniref:Uncharacterized protein n=1 Tax=Austropuccinia psidii MF-1 TaxID=1389203 RepID=A0A9Q3JM15_9BASI|nr:hypothetical protein [Austropuccinia psidii MF-1]
MDTNATTPSISLPTSIMPFLGSALAWPASNNPLMTTNGHQSPPALVGNLASQLVELSPPITFPNYTNFLTYSIIYFIATAITFTTTFKIIPIMWEIMNPYVVFKLLYKH